jgi:hypothetical protein
MRARMTLGEKLVLLAANCRGSATLVAPFIKAHAISAILSSLRPSVALAVYTRWRPEEVVAGVSDLAVLDLLQQRSMSTLRLCDTLHAKLYRFDDTVLIGSANLTGAALGWASRPNIELLRKVRRTNFADSFEAHLMRHSVAATIAIRDAIQDAADLLVAARPNHLDAREPHNDLPIPVAWLPRLRRPQLFYRAYTGDISSLTDAARDQYADDHLGVQVPYGLDKIAFDKYVRSVLLQQTLVGDLEVLLETPQRFGAIRTLTRAFLHRSRTDRDPGEATQTLLRWLLYFAPDRYGLRTGNYSEILFRK